MTRKIDEIILEGERITIVELIAPQVDEVFAAYEKGFDTTSMDMLMMTQMHIPEFVLNMITAPVKIADIVREKELAPSQYAHVYEKAQEVNNFLYQALQNFREKQERITDLQSVLTTMGGSDAVPSS